jgi:hypothetical protein
MNSPGRSFSASGLRGTTFDRAPEPPGSCLRPEYRCFIRFCPDFPGTQVGSSGEESDPSPSPFVLDPRLDAPVVCTLQLTSPGVGRMRPAPSEADTSFECFSSRETIDVSGRRARLHQLEVMGICGAEGFERCSLGGGTITGTIPARGRDEYAKRPRQFRQLRRASRVVGLTAVQPNVLNTASNIDRNKSAGNKGLCRVRSCYRIRKLLRVRYGGRSANVITSHSWVSGDRALK